MANISGDFLLPLSKNVSEDVSEIFQGNKCIRACIREIFQENRDQDTRCPHWLWLSKQNVIPDRFNTSSMAQVGIKSVKAVLNLSKDEHLLTELESICSCYS